METKGLTEKENGFGDYVYLKIEALNSYSIVLKVFLWIFFVLAFISLISNFLQLNLIFSYPFSMKEAEANDSRQMIIKLIVGLVFFITAIIFLIWIYKTSWICNRIASPKMKYSPGWAVGWFFIPIANIWMPFLVMREIWKVAKNPINWQKEKSSSLVGLWWWLWILSAFLDRLGSKIIFSSSGTPSQSIDSFLFPFKAGTIITIIGLVIAIIQTYLAISLVSSILRMLRTCIARIINEVF